MKSNLNFMNTNNKIAYTKRFFTYNTILLKSILKLISSNLGISLNFFIAIIATIATCLIYFEYMLMLKRSKLPNVEPSYLLINHLFMFFPGIGKLFIESILLWKK